MQFSVKWKSNIELTNVILIFKRVQNVATSGKRCRSASFPIWYVKMIYLACPYVAVWYMGSSRTVASQLIVVDLLDAPMYRMVASQLITVELLDAPSIYNETKCSVVFSRILNSWSNIFCVSLSIERARRISESTNKYPMAKGKCMKSSV